MHHQAVERVAPELVEMRLGEFLQKEKRLTSVANQLGVRVHNLPKRPPDVQDDRDFHYVVLGPSAASESGKPSPEAQKYIKEKSLSGDPRVYRNAILLLVPAKDGLDLLRARVQDYLGWEEVARLPDVGTLDDTIRALLRGHIENARKKIPEAVLQAYCIVVTVSSKGEIEAFKITPEDKPLFEIIKADKRSRILDQPFNPEALLPGGPYDLWQKGELNPTSTVFVEIVGF